jgi:hypothetical protein
MAEVAVPVSLMVSPVGQRSKLLKLYPAGPRKDVSAVQTRAERLAQSIDSLHCRTGVSRKTPKGRTRRPDRPWRRGNRSTGRLGRDDSQRRNRWRGLNRARLGGRAVGSRLRGRLATAVDVLDQTRYCDERSVEEVSTVASTHPRNGEEFSSRRRAEQRKAFVRIEEVRLDIIDNLGFASERLHRACEADPV